MATRNRPEELIKDALDGNCVPLGTYKARPDRDGWVSTIPSVGADHIDVDGDTEFEKFLHSETGAIISIPIQESKE